MKALFVIVLCLLPATTALFVGTWTQAIFWAVIMTPIVLGFVIGLFVPFIGREYGHYIGAFIADNNTRSNTLVAVAVLAIVSAFIGGLGAPLLQGSPEIAKITTKVAEAANYDNPSAKSALLQVLGNGEVQLAGATTAKERLIESPSWKGLIDYVLQKMVENMATIEAKPKVQMPPTPPRQYASWYNWLVAIFLIPCALLYWPIARRDEVVHAYQEVIERREQRKREGAQHKASTDATTTVTPIAPPPAPTRSTSGSWWTKWTFAKDFASDLGAEFIVEIVKQLGRLRSLRA